MKDPALRACSIGARGLWADMLCLMFESINRGHLQHATGKPVTAEQLARMTGCSAEEVLRLLQELEDSGVFSRTDNGVIYSRRMVRDEGLRSVRAEGGKLGAAHGRKGGRPPKVGKCGSRSMANGANKPLPEPLGEPLPKPLEGGQNNPPSSSSSSSDIPPTPEGAGEEEPSGVGPNPGQVAAHWNAHPGLMPCVGGDPHRDRMIRTWATGNALWAKHWRAVIAFMGRTPGYCGRGNLTWRADLGWLFKDSNFTKALEQMLADRSPAAKLPFVPKIHRAADIPFALLPEESDARAG